MPDDFQLGLLPERRIDWRAVAASCGFEAVLVVLLMGAGLLVPQQIQFRQRFTITELIPMPDKPTKSVRRQRPKLVNPPHPAIFPDAKLFVPKDLTQPKPKEPEVLPPKLEAKLTPPALSRGNNPPVRVVYTGSFGSSAPATVNAPIQQVQTGGFGDPNGLKGQGKPGAHLVVTQLGSFDLPAGPGKGNGTGGAHGVAGTVASSGFGSGIAQRVDRNSVGAVAPSKFGSQEVVHPAAPQPATSGPATAPVEILAKPRPVYTEEARALKIEGEVLLEVWFGANGQLRVNRVAQGLGHGLDEAAIAAASKIQFKSATQNGEPVDSATIVHVVFQLAY